MNDKVCLVTGVGEGTGAAIARRFASEGYQVAMHGVAWLARDHGVRFAVTQRAVPDIQAAKLELD